MSEIEQAGAQDWQRIAMEAIAAGASPAITAGQEERFDRETTEQAIDQAYTEWYQSDLLLVHEQTWDRALDTLATYGHEMRYVGMDGKIYYHALSTGLLVVGEAVSIEGDVMATALRLSARDNTISSHGLRRVLDKAQEDGSTKNKEAAQAALGKAVAWQGFEVQTYIVATNRDRLPRKTLGSVEIEVGYPRTALERAYYNHHEGKSLQRASEALQTPDVWVRAEPLPVFSAVRGDALNAEMYLSIPSLYTADQPNAYGKVPRTFEEKMDAATQHQRAVATLDDMLEIVRGPLQDVSGFHPSEVVNPGAY